MRAQALQARPRRRALPKDDGERSASAIRRMCSIASSRPDQPNRKWIADFTYVWIWPRAGSTSPAVIDLFSRRVVGWSMKAEMSAQLVTDALTNGDLGGAGVRMRCCITSDRGSQYTSEQFQRLIADNGVDCSMSRSGNVWDNAAMESFFSSLKTERIGRKVYRTRDAARPGVSDYIEGFCDTIRRHSINGYLSRLSSKRRSD